MWAAAVDPCVIAARARPAQSGATRLFYLSAAVVRALRGNSGEHLLIKRGGTTTRLDLIKGTALAGPCSLHFDLPADVHLERRIAAIRSLTSARAARQPHPQLARRLHALHAADARAAGFSLRDIADLVLGGGGWPGSGEHRKSLVRRMIAAGDDMVRAGPRAVL